MQPPLPRKHSGNLKTPPRTNVPLAVELHLALAHQQHRTQPSSPTPPVNMVGDDGDKVKPSSPLAKFNAMLAPGHNRNRSGSSTSMPVDSTSLHDDGIAPTSTVNSEYEGGRPSPNPRPGILRAHNRTPSIGQGGSPINPRTLRFDSSSSSERKAKDSPRSIPLPLRSFNSTGSLTKLNVNTSSDSPVFEREVETTLSDSRDEDRDQEENYGQPITTGPLVGSLNLPSVLLQRQRGQSFASSSESSLSPILSNDIAADPSLSVLNADFPFSINRAPSLPDEDTGDDITASPAHLNVPVVSDKRGRGDSLSSDSTSDSRSNMPMSSSGSGTSVTVASPGLSDILLPFDFYQRDLIQPTELPSELDGKKYVPPPLPLNALGLNERRAHSPLDIDITSISSHAQAEALVQRARQDVLELANAQEGSPHSSGLGRTPLSARLAAYGESLALERKLREQKAEESYWKDRVHDPMPELSPSVTKMLSPDQPTLPRQRSRDGVERQLSLENKTGSPRYKKRIKDPRRPSTADGPPSTKQHDMFFAQRTTSNQTSRSASTSNHSSEPLVDDTVDNSRFPGVDYLPVTQAGSEDIAQQEGSPRNPLVQEEESLSRINSADGADTETDSTPTVYRAGAPPSSNSRVRSAKKLTRMGIAVADQAAAASRTAPAPPTPPAAPTKRFGIRSIMQTLKGKT
ncbi:hypothetical protein GALMADRAFT_542905 [Galerina marginata CBS 339.88]|uniref:Uncharacterized protein n=1 Tax=Galerina marginata (strain CBS 339.88) TaxID=685588 RepID=A0A067SYX0_GALM3|nr:hypothetical protein GALMADRAFT_542905 [Galerina marginata CBS 339.88]